MFGVEGKRFFKLFDEYSISSSLEPANKFKTMAGVLLNWQESAGTHHQNDCAARRRQLSKGFASECNHPFPQITLNFIN